MRFHYFECSFLAVLLNHVRKPYFQLLIVQRLASIARTIFYIFIPHQNIFSDVI